VLLLFSGLVVLIRRSLKSDEDLIKSAFSALARSAGNEEATRAEGEEQQAVMAAFSASPSSTWHETTH